MGIATTTSQIYFKVKNYISLTQTSIRPKSVVPREASVTPPATDTDRAGAHAVDRVAGGRARVALATPAATLLQSPVTFLGENFKEKQVTVKTIRILLELMEELNLALNINLHSQTEEIKFI